MSILRLLPMMAASFSSCSVTNSTLTGEHFGQATIRSGRRWTFGIGTNFNTPSGTLFPTPFQADAEPRMVREVVGVLAGLPSGVLKKIPRYDPQQVVTQNGSLVITLEAAVPEDNHGLSYKGGMITTWNKFCFTSGLIEASVQLPGRYDVPGLWPAIWTMGNLGRAGTPPSSAF